MECLKDFIKFNSIICDELSDERKPSTSGLYWENLEGIKIRSVNDFTTEKYKGAIDLVNQRLVHAANQVIEEVIAQMPYHRMRPSVNYMQFGRWSANHYGQVFYNELANTLRGIKVIKRKSPLSFFEINAVRFFSKEAVTDLELKIIEGRTLGTPTKTTTIKFDSVAGDEVVIPVNLRIASDVVWILVNNGNVQTNQSYFIGGANGLNSAGENGCCGDSGGGWGNEYASVYGWDGANLNGQTYGIRAEISMKCDKELLLCAVAKELKMAILFRGGVEILNELVSSDRLNFITLYSKDWATEKIKEWYAKSNYYIQNNLENMSEYLSSLDCFCLQCSGTRFATVMP